MRIKYIDARPLGGELTQLNITVSGDRDSIFGTVQRVLDGLKKRPNGESERPFDIFIKPYYENRSTRQLKAIWAKINELASAMDSSQGEIYELMLRRYAPSFVFRTDENGLKRIKQTYRLVDVKEARSDNTFFGVAYLGLSQYDSKQAATFLDGVLSECKEIGISAEVE